MNPVSMLSNVYAVKRGQRSLFQVGSPASEKHLSLFEFLRKGVLCTFVPAIQCNFTGSKVFKANDGKTGGVFYGCFLFSCNIAKFYS